MRKNAYHASFPKFTCDVRTKLSEMNELFPELGMLIAKITLRKLLILS